MLAFAITYEGTDLVVEIKAISLRLHFATSHIIGMITTRRLCETLNSYDTVHVYVIFRVHFYRKNMAKYRI